MRRRIAAIAAVASVALVLSGCSALFPTNRSSTSTPTDEQVSAELAPYYHQQLQWASCKTNLQCAYAIAPLDWNDPGGERIKLALVRSTASGSHRLGSLLVNPGGPGVATLPYFDSGATSLVDSALTQSYDIVGWDTRGVGQSTAISCGSDSDALLDHYLFDIPTEKTGTDAWFAASDAATKALGDACLEATGPLLGHVGVADTARDMDMLRAALGDTSLHYLGYSYGTFYGQKYADLFPTKVGTLALDGVVDPTQSIVDEIVGQTAGFESNLRAYLADCLTRNGCPFHGTVDSAVKQISTLLDDLDTSPLRAGDGRQLGSSALYTAIITPLYSKSTWKYLDQLFAGVLGGDPTFAFTLADSYYSRDSDGTYTDNSFVAFQAAVCLDSPAVATVAETRAIVAQVKNDSLFGADSGYGAHSCYAWPEAPTNQPGPIVAEGSPDILVIGTTDDPATPYASAQKVASTLANGHLLTYRGEGHTAYNQGVTCVDSAVDAYLTAGTVPPDGTTC